MSAEVQGEHLLVQSPVISSSSDMYNTPFVSQFAIRGRAFCRTSFRRPHLNQSPRNISHLQLIYRILGETVVWERILFLKKETFRINFTTLDTFIIVNQCAFKCLMLYKVILWFYRSGNEATKTEDISMRYATLAVLCIFICSLSTLYFVYQTFPQVTEEEVEHMKVPWNIEDAKNLGVVLNRYKGDHYYHVMAGVFLTYIFLQTFAIPGSLFLSILSGYLFPFYMALLLVCTCSMVGATLCFLLSQLLGRRLVLRHFPERASKWKVQVDKHKDNLFNYMVFLRITPLLPNWFINLTAPVIGVPLIPFALGTFVGVAPPSFFAIQGGQTLHTMTIEDTTFNMNSFTWLAVFGIISIIPIFLKNRV